MAVIPKPPFPNVPKLPGVPQLLRSSNFPASPGPVIAGGVAAVRLLRALFSKPKWGIYKQTPPPTAATPDNIPTVTVRGNVQPIIVPDSVLDFGYRNEYDVADFPIQDGRFASYNKVANPYEASVRLSKGGSESDRQTFLTQIEAVLRTLDLYYILTPERTYVNVNLIRFELTRRGAGGAYFLTEVDLYFREVRSVTAQYTQTAIITQNAQNPSALPVTNRGTVAGEVPAQTPVLSGVVTQ